jgi:ATP-binding cassette subfamily C protein LapB
MKPDFHTANVQNISDISDISDVSDANATAANPAEPLDGLLPALLRLAQIKRDSIDRLALQEAVAASTPDDSPKLRLERLAEHLQLPKPRWRSGPDAADLPALVAAGNGQWGILRAQNAAGQWVVDWLDPLSQRWQETPQDGFDGSSIATLRLAAPYRVSNSPILSLVMDELKKHKGKIAEGAAGGFLLAFLGILVSFYAMQVYDRVIPTGAMQTLLVLTLGIAMAIVLEYVAKRLRSRVYEQLVDAVDSRLARTVYLRFLSIRLDQLPPSVGTLASQLRGYETVRGFLLTLVSQLAVDAPFALVFALVIWAIAGPLALIPLGFFVIALALSAWHAGRIRLLALRSQQAANRKTGLLVESVEAAEIIKSGQGGWRMLSRWLVSSDESRELDLETRHLNEAGQYRAMALQQIAYVLLIAAGAWMASRGEITMGALIACTMLSGRVLGPATQLSGQLTAWAHVKAALQGLDGLWKLETDHHGQAQAVHVDNVQGSYRFERVSMSLRGQPALAIAQLKITAGEKIGVLGPIGAGKTTLLRLLSGMYKPTEGRIWLDDVDLAQLSKPKLADSLGYLPQEGRLLGGTLRENLLLGLMDPGDESILQAARVTGLFEAVIAAHPQGLQQEINEGGSGLSGGQRQLVNLTRVFLRRPRIWLLDEPTASLDRALEQQIVRAFKGALRTEDTLVLVTHKPELLQLVDRIIVVARHQVMLDGPRDEVLARLKTSPAPATGAASSAAATPAAAPSTHSLPIKIAA